MTHSQETCTSRLAQKRCTLDVLSCTDFYFFFL